MITPRLPVAFLAAMLGMVAAAIIAVAGSLASAQEEAGLTSVVGCTGETIELNDAERRMLDLHNEARAYYELSPLCVHPLLTGAARAHSQEMLERGYLSHDSSDGESVDARLQRFGYTPAGYSYWAYGENIAWGSGDADKPDYRFDEWMSSADHRANILDADFSEAGIGVITDAYSGTTTYTVDFGTRY